MCATRGIAMRVVLALDPGSLEFAAGAGALFIQRAAYTLTDFTEQSRAAHGFVFRAAHDDPVR
jgi:hypothetical protein